MKHWSTSPVVLSCLACSGLCGGDLSLLSNTVTTLERDSPRVKPFEMAKHVKVFIGQDYFKGSGSSKW